MSGLGSANPAPPKRSVNVGGFTPRLTLPNTLTDDKAPARYGSANPPAESLGLTYVSYRSLLSMRAPTVRNQRFANVLWFCANTALLSRSKPVTSGLVSRSHSYPTLRRWLALQLYTPWYRTAGRRNRETSVSGFDRKSEVCADARNCPGAGSAAEDASALTSAASSTPTRRTPLR